MDRYAEFVFAEAFRAARTALKMTQKELGKELDVDVAQIGTWEKCRSFPPIDYWGVIKDVLGIDVITHDKARSGVGLTDFCNAVYKLRIGKRLTRGEFKRQILLDRRPNVELWERGEAIPSVTYIERMEEALKDIPGIECLRPAWEKEVAKLPETEQSYYRGQSRYRQPRRKTPVIKEKSYHAKIRSVVVYDVDISATSEKAARAKAMELLSEGALNTTRSNITCRLSRNASAPSE